MVLAVQNGRFVFFFKKKAQRVRNKDYTKTEKIPSQTLLVESVPELGCVRCRGTRESLGGQIT